MDKNVWETTYDEVKLNRLFPTGHTGGHCKPSRMWGAVLSILFDLCIASLSTSDPQNAVGRAQVQYDCTVF